KRTKLRNSDNWTSHGFAFSRIGSHARIQNGMKTHNHAGSRLSTLLFCRRRRRPNQQMNKLQRTTSAGWIFSSVVTWKVRQPRPNVQMKKRKPLLVLSRLKARVPK